MLKEQSEKWFEHTETGLSAKEASDRLVLHGENVLEEVKPKSALARFLEQLNEPLIFVLFVAAAISMLLHEFEDTMIILVVILVNAIVGVIQEGKAQKAMEALKKLTSPIALVKRDGQWKEIEARNIVPGDVIGLDAGRQVPADIRLVTSASLKVEESALTGESVPAEKDADFIPAKELPIADRKHMVHMSTSVVYGRGEGIVQSTGMHTEIGKIAGLINETDKELTPLQKRLGELGKLLSVIAVVLCILLFGIAILQRRNVLEMLITAISLAVAAVPEGLPAIVTIVFALSVSRMVKVNTIIRRMPSVETLGAVNVVCTDKTGTLTQNKMTVIKCFFDQKVYRLEQLVQNEKSVPVEFLHGFMLCNDGKIESDKEIGDPTELAFLHMGERFHIKKEKIDMLMPRCGEKPFDSKRKMMTTVHQSNGNFISYTKGSGDEILKRCTYYLCNGKVISMSAREKKQIQEKIEEMSAEALRVLALAMKKGNKVPSEDGLVFIGLAGMMDPSRPEVPEAIALFKKAEVKTVMITGDHVKTAFAIAKQLRIAERENQCISGEEVDRLSDEELKKKSGQLAVFARVSPEHKVRIVKAFKDSGNIVAMTGDGVNDAPSLKTADIGIAMGKNGTDVAKNASDVILTDDNFSTIEKAIEEGRGIYENIRKSVLFLLSSNFGEIITMFISVLLGLASPLKASHILWINLITDSLPALALGVDKNNEKLLMEKPPRNAKESLFAHGGMFCTLFYGTLIAGISLTAFLTIPYTYLSERGMAMTVENIMLVLEIPGILSRSQTYAFTVLGISQLFHAIGMRNVELSIFRMKHGNNKLMIAAFLLGLSLQVLVTECPYFVNVFGTASLSIREWGQLILLAALPLLAHEMFLFHPIQWIRSGVKKEKNYHLYKTE